MPLGPSQAVVPPRAPRPWMRAIFARLRPDPELAPAVPTPAAPPCPFRPEEDRLPPLALNSDEIAFTDASRTRDGCLGVGGCLGAAEFSYRAQGSVQYGELLAMSIRIMLHPAAVPLHLLSDSLSGLHLISRAIFYPTSVSTHPFSPLLTAIRAAVLTRSAPTTLGKVRGHSGVRGNERADACAGRGTAPDAPPVPADLLPRIPEGEVPHVHMPPDALGVAEPMDADDEHQEPDCDADPMDSDAPAAPPAPPAERDLFAGVFAAAHRYLTQRRACAPLRTATAEKLRALFGPDLKRIALKASQYFMTPKARVSHPGGVPRVLGVTSYARTLCLKLRYRAVYRAPDSTCPLPGCGCWDHAAHWLGNCLNPIIHGMICSKHNDGGQLVIQACKNASGDAIIANVGNGAVAQHEHTLPAWLGLEDNRQAPDILIVKNWRSDLLATGRFPTGARDKKRVTLLFAEYKTCSDYKFAETQEGIWEKYTPHSGSPRPHRRHLFDELRAKGWRVEGLNAAGALGCTPSHDRMVPILLGHGGFILQSTVDVVFQTALGLTRTAAHKLACSLNAHQVTAASSIFRTAYSLRRVGANPAAPAVAGGPSSSVRATLPVPSGVG